MPATDLDSAWNPAKVSAPGIGNSAGPEAKSKMDTIQASSTQLSPTDLFEIGQVAAGVVVLVAILTALAVTGRLRRAFDFPPRPANAVEGIHLLFVLIVFLMSTWVFSLALTAVGVLPSEAPATPAVPATQATPATAPADSQPQIRPAMPTPAESPDNLSPEEPRTTEVRTTDENPADFLVLGLAELITVAVMVGMIPYLFPGGLRGFGLRADRLGRDVAWATIGYLAFWPVCFTIAMLGTYGYEWLFSQEVPEHDVLKMLQEPEQSAAWTAVAWILAGGIAPLFEELVFRGFLLTWLRNVTRSPWLAILLSGAAFGLIHHPQWHLVPALAALGILLGYLYARTGSLTLVVLFHAIFNLRTLLLT